MKKFFLLLFLLIFTLSSCNTNLPESLPAETSTLTDKPTTTATSTPTYTVTPSPTPSVEYKLFGINFGPYTQNGQNPNYGTIIPVEQLEEEIALIAPYTQWIRTYGCSNLEEIVTIAHAHGLKVAFGAWLSEDVSANDKEISCLVEVAKLYQPELLIVGSETLYREDLSAEQLISYIDQVRSENTGIPVATADTNASWMNNPDVIEASDILLTNIYPYWDGIELDHSVANLDSKYASLRSAAGGKEIWVSETGWPDAGNAVGEATPSAENAAYYFLNFISWARKNEVKYFYFEAFDEPWKESSVNPQEAHWGIWTENYEMKTGMEKVFEGEDIADNWTPTQTPTPTVTPAIVATRKPTEIVPTGAPSISIALPQGVIWPDDGVVRGYAKNIDPSQYKVAVYIKVDGGWWTKPYWDNPLTRISSNGYWECRFVTGGNDANATEIVAFLVAIGTNVPAASGGGLPELGGAVKAKISR